MVALALTCLPHPSCLAEEELLKQCTWWADRRSGPGGQHRNKVQTAVVMEHQASGVRAEASERRSQPDNRRLAIRRLRLALAVQVRSPELLAAPSALWQQRAPRGRLSVSAEHPELACLLAEVLDRLATVDYALADCAQFFGVSSSQLVKLLRSWPPALAHVNALRAQRGLHKLS